MPASGFLNVQRLLTRWMVPSFCLPNLLVLWTISACSGGDTPTPSPSPTAPEESVTPEVAPGGVRFLHPYADQVLATDSLAVYLSYDPDVSPESLQLSLNGTTISGVSCDPTSRECRVTGVALGEPGPKTLQALVTRTSGEKGKSTVSFEAYPGQALALPIEHPQQLIEGPETKGRIGDILLSNGRIQVVISALGRDFDYLHTFGGHIIDADLLRLPWEPERDGLGVVGPAINIEAGDNPQSLIVLNDGKDGQPAQVQTIGPDELMVAMNASTMAPLLIPPEVSELPIGTYIPASADDKDLPLEVTSTYRLEPGANYVTYETKIRNIGNSNASFYLGDFLNATGEMDYFSPGFGFRADIYFRHEGEFFGFTGFGSSAGLSYGLIPTTKPNTTVSLPGTFITFASQDAQAIIFESVPPNITLAPNAFYTFTRHFVVGTHLADVTRARCGLLQLDCGTVKGKVTKDGKPAAGANVTLWRPATITEAYTNRTEQIITHWRTLEDGTFEGQVEVGRYRVSAELPHARYSTDPSSNSTTPPTIEVEIEAGQTRDNVTFNLPSPGTLRVQVTDELGQPISARVTLAGFDPSPDPLVSPVVFPGYDSTGAYFSDVYADKLPYGVVTMANTDAAGDTGPVPIEPGEYWMVVSHGPFFSIWSEKVTIPSDGTVLEKTAQLARVITASGFYSGDFHVHGIDSFDARVPRDNRLKAMAAEGVDVFASTDHNTRIDFTPLLADLGLADRVVGIVGEEITTFDLGHFNAFPMPLVSTARNSGSVDWAGPFAPGMSYPSQGRYDVSPSELFASVHDLPGDRILMSNHPNTRTLGYFSLIGLNTADTNGPKAYVPTCLGRQAPDTNLWDDGFDALELWRTYEDDPSLLLAENMGDWFNLLNQGIVRTSMSNSDSHASYYIPVGGPRNLIALDTTVPFTPEGVGPELTRRIREGRVINTNAPLLDVRLEATDGTLAGHALPLPTQLSAPDGTVRVQIRVQSAQWAQFDEVQLYVNHAPVPVFDDKDDAPGRTYPFSNCPGSEVTMTDVPRYDVVPEEGYSWVAGRDFVLELVNDHPELPGAGHWEAELEIPLILSEDSWVVVLVRGNEGVSQPLFPVQPTGLDDRQNQDLADLMDGNLGEGGVMAQAYTNPLFVDVNENGRFDAPGLRVKAGPGPRTRQVKVQRESMR